MELKTVAPYSTEILLSSDEEKTSLTKARHKYFYLEEEYPNVMYISGKLHNLKQHRKYLKRLHKNPNNFSNYQEQINSLNIEIKELEQVLNAIITFRDYTDEELFEIKDLYKKWLKENIVLSFYDNKKEKAWFWKAPKKGNSVYSKHLKKQVKEKLSFFDKKEFETTFGLRNKKGYRDKISNTFFVTLTCDPKKFNNNRKKAWVGIEKLFNSFITNCRGKFDKLSYIKAVESTKKGYPHIHLIIVTKRPYAVFKHNKYFRLKQKNKFQKCWKGGFVDVVAPKSNYGNSQNSTVLNYVLKDMLKTTIRKDKTRTEQDYFSLAITWLHGKRTLSISGFSDLIKEIRVTQSFLEEVKEKSEENKLEFIGIFRIKKINGMPPPDLVKINISKEDLLSQLNIVQEEKEVEPTKINFKVWTEEDKQRLNKSFEMGQYQK